RIPTLSKELPKSTAALKAHHKQHTAACWNDLWKASPRCKKLAKFDKSPPSCKVLKLYKDLPRHSCSILTQLHTAHIGLNSFLHKIKVVDSPLCPLCSVHKDVKHFLLHC
ncbi:hypothetical protein K439DRAFT_1281670, partial [Ramaria rubella]